MVRRLYLVGVPAKDTFANNAGGGLPFNLFFPEATIPLVEMTGTMVFFGAVVAHESAIFVYGFWADVFAHIGQLAAAGDVGESAQVFDFREARAKALALPA